MKKICIVTGELSGDRLGAWYLKKRLITEPDLSVQAIGGDFLHEAGATLYKRFEELNVTGIVEIIRHLPKLLNLLRTISQYIIDQRFDEVVLVDFPGFNMRLARLLKEKNPKLTITYLSPPQLWCWGAWRIKPLKKYCDKIIVLYPFEVAWYAQRGLTVQWQGSLVYELLAGYHKVEKKTIIALIPGSRHGEIEKLLPLFMKAAALVKKQHPEVSFVLPLARSISHSFLQSVIEKHKLGDIWSYVKIIQGEQKKFSELAACRLALSKPGTVTLELALLGVPTLVAYKTSWLTYYIARLVVSVAHMSLPNLLLGRQVFPETIQHNCHPDFLAHQLITMYGLEQNNQPEYHKMMSTIAAVRTTLCQ